MGTVINLYNPEKLSAKDKKLREKAAKLLHETVSIKHPQFTIEDAYEVYDAMRKKQWEET